MIASTRRIELQPYKNKSLRNESRPQTKTTPKTHDWPFEMKTDDVRWFPASNRLIGLVRANVDKFVLPPAVVRKAAWRE